ncbi:MAG: PIN domain-containing protein [Anaerolineae bacterium]|nr:PIN domain-containing protein [Anaerolineae bacterium]
MVDLPKRILLDTNVFILAHLDGESPEGRILAAISTHPSVTLILSNEIMEQIQRVSRRVGGKDWTGLLINRVWQDFSIDFVTVSIEEKRAIEAKINIPREDIGIYITAIRGNIDCLISSNHEFVQQTAKVQNLFETMSARAFVEKFLT